VPNASARIVTLLTDFGERDTYVGVMKGVLFSRAPSLRAVVDLTHAIPPQDVEDGAQHLAEAWTYFPAGTVHVAVVDPGVGSARALLAGRREGHVFLAPDNGLLSFVLTPEDEVRRIDVERFALPGTSRTFHGRDVFAPTAAALVEGLAFEDVGPGARDWKRLNAPGPTRLGAGRLQGRIRRVDRFGNLVSDVDREALEHLCVQRGGSPRVRVKIADLELDLVDTYAAARTGDVAALINSSGHVEIAVRDGDAAARLGLGRGAKILVELEP
jgi:S-adenosyl-L-methionine hydrolase (adenosine-forming)